MTSSRFVLNPAFFLLLLSLSPSQVAAIAWLCTVAEAHEGLSRILSSLLLAPSGLQARPPGMTEEQMQLLQPTVPSVLTVLITSYAHCRKARVWGVTCGGRLLIASLKIVVLKR